MDLVRLTLAANPAEAELIQSLLKTEGIESMRKQTDFGAGTMDGFSGGQQEILVEKSDFEAGQALISER